MENLLYEILKCPSPDSILKVEVLLDSLEGPDMFINLLISNNIMAYSYMKMQAKDWLMNIKRQDFILKYKNTFYNLVLTSDERNFPLLCDFFCILFTSYFYWPDFIDFLVQNQSNRSLKVLSTVFVKFRIMPKSDKLFSEIISCIIKSKPLFLHEINSFELLNIFYSLVYQDIHPFFEENIDHYISALVNGMKKKENQKLVCEIYNLFILKYPDLLDFTKILGSLLISIDSFDYYKYTVILNILKKDKKSVLKFEDILVNAIRLGSVLTKKEMEEMTTLEYSKNILSNSDSYRGIIIDLIHHFKSNELLSNCINEESEIFLYTAMKRHDLSIIKKCQILINHHESDPYLAFAAFRYLLTIKEYSSCDAKFIVRDHPCAYLCCEMISRYIQKISPLEDKILSNLDLGNGVDYSNIVTLIINFLKDNEEDQYSCYLLNRIIKEDIKYFTGDLYKFLLEYINIRNINSPLAVSYIFDIFGILVTKTDFDETDLINIINIIISEEITELYPSAFYLLAIIILHSKKDYSNILSLLNNENIWKSKELLLPVVILTISLYKKGYMSDEQINYITGFISKYYSNILLSNTTLIYETEDIEEYFILKSNIIDTNYTITYKNMMEYCTENYITKKNTRRVIRAFIKGSKVVKDEMYKNILEKNKMNLSYDNVPYSVYINFDI